MWAWKIECDWMVKVKILQWLQWRSYRKPPHSFLNGSIADPLWRPLSPKWGPKCTLQDLLLDMYCHVANVIEEVLHQFWWKGVATLPWGARDIHLCFNQHYTYAPGAFCYTLSTAGTSTATGQESSTCWSLTVLKFDRIAKKKKKSSLLCRISLWAKRCHLLPNTLALV